MQNIQSTDLVFLFVYYFSFYQVFKKHFNMKITLIFNILIPFDPYNSILISDEEKRLRKLK